jgi:hypothetical protein
MGRAHFFAVFLYVCLENTVDVGANRVAVRRPAFAWYRNLRSGHCTQSEDRKYNRPQENSHLSSLLGKS